MALQVAEKQANDSIATEFRELGPPPHKTAKQIETFGNLFFQLFGFSGTARELDEKQLADAMLKSQEYTGAEIGASVASMHRQLDHLGTFLNSYVLAQEVERLDVPVHFVQGKHDLNTPTDLARDYFETLEAPRGKFWHLYDDAAHLPMYEHAEGFADLLRSIEAGEE